MFRDVAEVGIKDPCSFLAEPSLESFHLKHAPDYPLFTSTPASFYWRLPKVPDPTTYRASSPVFAFLCNRAQYLTPPELELILPQMA